MASADGASVAEVDGVAVAEVDADVGVSPLGDSALSGLSTVSIM